MSLQRKQLLFFGLIAGIMLFAFLGFSLVNATVDGAQGSTTYQGKVLIEGIVTKDITDISNIWKGVSSGSGTAFTLSGYDLLTSEFIPSGQTQNIGNITANADKITHSKYNDSGLLDVSDWTETDSGSVLTVTSNVETGDQNGAPRGMRLFATTTGATSTANLAISLATPITGTKYITVGLRVNTESYNATSPSFQVQFLNSSSSWIGFGLKEGATDWTASNNLLEIDDDAGDVLMYESTVSHLASACGQTSFGSITQLKLIVNNDSSAWQGSVSIDVFCLVFSDSALKFGRDYNDILTAADDWVYLNVTTPSSPTVSLRELHSTTTKILDAQLNFFKEQAYKSVSLAETTGKITYEYDVTVLTASASDYEDDLTWSSVNYWYILDGVYGDNAPVGSKVYEFYIASVSKVDLLINEEAGDAISIDTSVSVSSTMTAKNVKIVKDATLAEKRLHGNIFYVLNTYISIPLVLIGCLVASVFTWGALIFKRGKVPGVSLDDQMKKSVLGRFITLVVFIGFVIVTAILYVVLLGMAFWALATLLQGFL